jgi:hypothetical protein
MFWRICVAALAALAWVAVTLMQHLASNWAKQARGTEEGRKPREVNRKRYINSKIPAKNA